MGEDDALDKLIETLTRKFNRLPTEKELLDFIFGDDKTRVAVWNQTQN